MEAQASYCTPGFADYYDLLLQHLPAEYEPGKDVQCVYWPLTAALLRQQPSAGQTTQNTVTVVDLCTGSGRVALGLLEQFQHWPGWPSPVKLRIVGVDSSAEMLTAARSKLQQATGVGGSAGPAGGVAEVCFHQADMAALQAAPQLAALQGSCSLVLISAGSFHHLESEAEQLQCLRGVAAALSHTSPGGASSLPAAVINIFDSAHLEATPGETAVIDAFRRTCLQQERLQQADGGVVWRQRFQLERYSSTAAADAADNSQLMWQQLEEWALREVAPGEFKKLASAAGLVVLRQQARWADGLGTQEQCCDTDARIFVIGLQA